MIEPVVVPSVVEPLPPETVAEDVVLEAGENASATASAEEEGVWEEFDRSLVRSVPGFGLGSNFHQGYGLPTLRPGTGGTSVPWFGMTNMRPQGFGIGGSLSALYDTNPGLGYVEPGVAAGSGDSSDGDFSISLGGSASYASKPSDIRWSLATSAGYSEYFNRSELSGFNLGSVAGNINYDGGKLNLGAAFNAGYGSGANRYYGAVVDEFQFGYGLNGSYEIGPKTSVQGSFGQSLGSADGYSDISSFNAGLGLGYRYSPRTQFNGGLAYSVQSGDTGEDLISIGPNVGMSYQVSKKVSASVGLGLNFNEYGNGESVDPSFSTSASLAYRPSELWGMSLGVNRGFQADPARAGGFTENTSFRFGYDRRILIASFGMGISYEMRDELAPSGVGGGGGSNDGYISMDYSLGIPFTFAGCGGAFFVRYTDSEAAITAQDSDSLQVGVSLGKSF